jgi:dynein heavy chain
LRYQKNRILAKIEISKVDGNWNCYYRVNFQDEFKTLIKETKQLEKMGYKINQTTINISKLEKEFYGYIDRLQIMLREYDEAVHTL